VQSVAVQRGSDASTATEVAGAQEANGSWSVKVSADATADSSSTFVRVVQKNGNSVEMALAQATPQ
jgi:hypothetical protein